MQQGGVLAFCCCRSILSSSVYTKLIRPEVDGEEYEPNRFQDGRLKAFRLWVLTSACKPEEFVDKLYRINIKLLQ
jgi:hypothetical protein